MAIPTTTTKYTIRGLRLQYGLSQCDLAEMSGISVNSIVRIETGQSTGIHNGVAWALADAFGVLISDIDWPAELTHRGRPPMTGRPLRQQAIQNDECCNACFLVKSLSGTCGCTA